MKILVFTDDRIGDEMTSAARRAWHIGRTLHQIGHRVAVVGAAGSSRPSEGGPEVTVRPHWRGAGAVISPPWCLPPRALVGRHRIIVDGTTPRLAELAAMADAPDIVQRRRRVAARLPLAAARADAVLVAGDVQRAWWRDRIGSRDVPILEVPSGIPDDDPDPGRDDIPGVPRGWAVLLWWAGHQPWLDLETLLAARARLGGAPLSLVVSTSRRPGSDRTQLDATSLLNRARRHGLQPPMVVPLEDWVPTAERHRLLNRVTALAILHHPGGEADLSFRSGALDGLWAGVPLLLTEGGAVAILAREHGWGAVVPPTAPAATAAALELLLGERTQQRCRAALARDRDDWRWSRRVAPLADAFVGLGGARRGSLTIAGVRSATALAGRGHVT